MNIKFLIYNNKIRVVLAVLLCFPLIALAQEKTELNTFKTENENLNFLSQVQTAGSATEIQLLGANVNMVLLAQIGDENVSNVQSYAEEQSLINILQQGDANYVTLDLEARNIESNILQSGTNNIISDYSFTQNNLQTEINQNGNNLILEKFGSNSISNGLIINMTGNFDTLVIRSFQ